ncbi:hypothetical protein ADEAN_000479800 [Angomonas deanei]|uniref:Uncharacterized protein n=1 Tax=Angomonas deanei TaxID=59799 RepID=A0A7G2CBY0_9TRYP|nr:hypothetical protein ADEAN_000479800 [Angomonas deanei]
MESTLTEEELRVLLPYFDARQDMQIGGWVMIRPARMELLLTPLVKKWESAGECPAGFPPRRPLTIRSSETLTAKQKQVGLTYTLAPLSVARQIFSLTRKQITTNVPFLDEEGTLFLHLRHGLLTPSVPPELGGTSGLEVILMPNCGTNPGEDRFLRRIIFLESGFQSARDGVAPAWLHEVSCRAKEEWRAHFAQGN